MDTFYTSVSILFPEAASHFKCLGVLGVFGSLWLVPASKQQLQTKLNHAAASCAGNHTKAETIKSRSGGGMVPGPTPTAIEHTATRNLASFSWCAQSSQFGQV